MKWIKAPKLPDELLRSYYCKIYNNVFKKEFKKQVLITLDGTWQTGDFDTVIEWLDESDLPNEPSIDIRSISEKWVGIWHRGENPNLFQCVDEAIKEALKGEPSIQEDKFIDRLFTNLNKLGYDTSNCDGDTDPAEIIAHWVDCLVKDSKPKPLQEDDRLEEFSHQINLDPYPEDIFLPIPTNVLEMIHNTLIEEYKMPIDRLLGHIGRLIRRPLKDQFNACYQKYQPLQEDCHCTPDQTTGHTAGKCNVCGKEQEDAAIQHADSLHKKGSSELAGNGKLTENDCWENAYFNFKEGSKQLNK